MAADIKSVTVRLGGKDWPIPELSGRRIIKFTTLASGIVIKNNPAQMAEEDFLRVYEVIYTGVQQGTPDLTFEEFLDDYPIKYEELLAAFPTVAKQAGLETASGEAGAESLSKEL